jgi:hypothetical protein
LPGLRGPAYTGIVIQSQQPFIVTLVPEPSRTMTIGDVIVASLGLAGALTLAAALVGVLLALGLILWRRWHPPEVDRLPSVTPVTPLQPPSAPIQ